MSAPATTGSSRLWAQRWFRRSIIAVGVLLLLWLLRYRILYLMGAALITADPHGPVDAVYVLGGAPIDRGIAAAEQHALGIPGPFIFTSKNIPTALQSLGMDLPESELCRRVAVAHGVPEAATRNLVKGTSTMEEALAILQDAQHQGYQRVMILSSSFHLRRIRFVFRKRFKQEGIDVVLRPAAAVNFSEDRWWESEEGLLMVYNEYVKLVYYWLRY